MQNQEACQHLGFVLPQPRAPAAERAAGEVGGSQKSGGQRGSPGLGRGDSSRTREMGEHPSPAPRWCWGAQDLGVMGPRHPRVDPRPRRSWLHQSCPQPCDVGTENHHVSETARVWVVMTPAVNTVNLQRLWGSCRRPISLPLPLALVQSQEKGGVPATERGCAPN